MRQNMEGCRGETLRLQKEVNKLKAEIEVQKGLADMYNEGFEEITLVLQQRETEYLTFSLKFGERKQRGQMNR